MDKAGFQHIGYLSLYYNIFQE